MKSNNAALTVLACLVLAGILGTALAMQGAEECEGGL